MPAQLFVFIQMEFPWALGPPDGRYLLRSEAGGEPEHVVVLNTLTTQPRARIRRSSRPTSETPAQVPISRATVIDPVPLQTEPQAKRWLSQLNSELESAAAAAVIDRVLFAQRIASADPYTHELSASQALIIRAGWGEGAEVADGRFSHARELPASKPRSRGRASALRPQERLAVLLGARGQALICEELALRARLDLDQGRLSLAAIELAGAYEAALSELIEENRTDLALRIQELSALRERVQQAASGAMPGAQPEAEMPPAPQDEVIRHALERLEAALRARTAAGFD